ncbi:MAG: SPOR domain-containing protein [Bacteroidota bacterium]
MNDLSLPALLGLSLLFFLPSLTHATQSEKIEFLYADFQEVQSIANNEGKPYLAFFSANWCMPWQWMEQHTLADPTIVQFTNDHFLATKIDIDQQSGKQLQQKLEVGAIPTLLIFDPDGVLLERVESAIEAPELLHILRKYQHHRAEATYALSASERLITTPKPTIAITRPALMPLTTISIPTAAAPVRASAPQAQIEATAPPKAAAIYSIQIGAYSNYENAQTIVNKLKLELQTPVKLVTEERSGNAIFKIFVGHFNSMNAAKNYQVNLKRQSISGFVKKIYI